MELFSLFLNRSLTTPLSSRIPLARFPSGVSTSR